MNTINQLIYNVRQLIRDTSDDPRLSDRNIEFMINYLREKLIVQQLQKNRSISSNIVQDLGQIEVIKIDKNDNGSIVTGKTTIRTKNKVPKPIELDQVDLITYVGGLDKQSPFDIKSKFLSGINKYNKYSSKLPIAYYYNEYVYIDNCPNPNLKWINIEGVFSNPREATKFTKPDGSKCYDPDLDNYPLSGRHIDMLNSLIKEKELNLFFNIPEDITNDANNTE